MSDIYCPIKMEEENHDDLAKIRKKIKKNYFFQQIKKMDLVKNTTPTTKTIVERLENLEKCCEESKKFKLESEKKIDTLEKTCQENRKIITDLIYSNERVRKYTSFSDDMRYIKFLIDNFDFSQSVDYYNDMIRSLGVDNPSSLWIEYFYRGVRYLDDDDRLEILFRIIDKYTKFNLNYINSNPTSFWEGDKDKDEMKKKFERIFKRMKDDEDKSKGDDFPSDGRKRKNKSRRRSMKKKKSHKKKF